MSSALRGIYIIDKGEAALIVGIIVLQCHLNKYIILYTLKIQDVIVEGSLAPVACLADPDYKCDRCDKCKTLPMWTEFYELEKKFFYGKKISDLL